MKPTITDLIYKTERVAWRSLNQFQPELLKKTTPKRIDKLKNSLIKNGFAMPFFAFEDKYSDTWVLDGHHRLIAFNELEKSGADVPTHFTCNFIRIRDEAHARKLVLAYGSKYADFDDEGLADFISDLNLEDINLEFDIEIKEPKEKKAKVPRECPHSGMEI